METLTIKDTRFFVRYKIPNKEGLTDDLLNKMKLNTLADVILGNDESIFFCDVILDAKFEDIVEEKANVDQPEKYVDETNNETNQRVETPPDGPVNQEGTPSAT